MKRALSVLLAALIAVGALTGCAGKGGPEPEVVDEPQAGPFETDNEIFTYQKIDPQKTQIVVSRTGNISVEGFCRKFESLNPDVQVIYLDITGGNSNYQPFTDWITMGFVPDVVISSASFLNDELTTQYFENLSGNPIIQNYSAAALKRISTDGEIFCLPGPSDISAMTYNKTLFEQYGWQVPVTFDEFVALCDRIAEDTGGAVEPWNPNAKYSTELQTAIEAFTYEQIFAGLENRTWYNEYVEGKGSFTGHMEPYFEVMETLVEHGLLREEHFSYSATTRGKEFAAGSIAMINGNIGSKGNDQFDFGFMPYPTVSGELGYICDSYSCYVGIPKKEHTESEQEAISRFLEFFSSPEGQSAYIGSDLKVSNVNGVAFSQSDDIAALQPALDAGHMFAYFDFYLSSGGYHGFSLHQMALDITTGQKTAEQCVAEADASEPVEEAPTNQPELLAVAKDMTILETSFYMADAYREAAGADIGLIANNEVYRGNMMKFFAGEVTSDMVTVFKPRSFANDSTLVKVSMTGAQILEALNSPVGNEQTADCIYAYSGLKCEVAPWKELGSKYLSVKLADGTELEPERLYTLAFWDGTVNEQYITERLESFEGSWEELMTARIKADGEIAPADDGRITLVWDT